MLGLVVGSVLRAVQLKVINLRTELDLNDHRRGSLLNVLPGHLLRLLPVVASVESFQGDAPGLFFLCRFEFFQIADLSVEHWHAEEAPELVFLLGVGAAGAGITNNRFYCVRYGSKVNDEVLLLLGRRRVQEVPYRRLHGEDVHYRLNNWVIWRRFKDLRIYRLIRIAFTEARHYTQELPGQFAIGEDLGHAGVFYGVLWELLKHETLVCVDDAF